MFSILRGEISILQLNNFTVIAVKVDDEPPNRRLFKMHVRMTDAYDVNPDVDVT